MDVAQFAVLAATARVHAARLEVAAHRAGRDFAIHVLARQPDLDVVGLLRGEAHVAGAERHHAIVQIELLQHVLGAFQHALMLGLRLFRRRDRNQLDLGELMLADHAARVLAGRARLGAEARRAGGQTHRQCGFLDDGFTHEIGERHFGGRDEPEIIGRLEIGLPQISAIARCRTSYRHAPSAAD